MWLNIYYNIYVLYIRRTSELMEKLKTYREDLFNETNETLLWIVEQVSEEEAIFWLSYCYLILVKLFWVVWYDCMNLQFKDAYDQLATAWANYRADPFGRISTIISLDEIKEKLYLLGYYVSLLLSSSFSFFSIILCNTWLSFSHFLWFQPSSHSPNPLILK